TNETVQMAILAETSIVYIAKIEPLDAPLRINTQIGTRRPVHCTALGKVLTAWRDPAEVDAIIGEAGLTRFTDATIT
ncbi:IclR family transcriptional regulator domain-containing protein, partial [Serratia marcescens]|uniref:IclR family transcriptional regulator domain-containing protein n=1 Tax=Serratia marcescens TaxID=615 RepID=UPI0023B828A4